MNIKQIIIFLLLLSIITIPTNAAVNYIFFPGNNTAVIYNTVNNNWYFKLERVGLEKNISVLTETINVTAYVNYTLSCGELNFRYNKYKGNHNISSIDYYLINQTTGNENQFDPCGQDLKKNKSYLVKASAHKEPEFNFSILLDLHVYGLSIKELTWWNGSWLYSYNNLLPNATRPYQYSLNVSNNTVAFGNTTHLNVTCSQVNCTDLRFVRDNTTEESYWRQTNTSVNGSGYATFWFNVTANGTGFQIYSGATGVSDASNGTNTFVFFGDNINKFAFSDPAKWSLSNNILTSSNTVGNTGGSLVGVTGLNFIYETVMKTPSQPSGNYGLDVRYTNYDSNVVNLYFGRTSGVMSIWQGDGWAADSASFIPDNVAYAVKFVVAGNNVYGYADANQLAATTLRISGTTTEAGTVVGFRAGNLANQQFDTLRIRKYASPEPVWAIWGAAQTQASNFSPIPVINTITTGNFYINTTWINGSGTIITDLFNSTNGTVWINSSLPYRNTSLNAHGWQNLSIYPFNITYGLNTSALINTTRVPNNAPVQNIIGNKSVYAGSWLNFTITSTDLDGDSLSYATNATKGTLTTNNFSWLTNISEAGNHTFKFNTTDNFSAVSNEENVSLSILANLTLSSPTNLSTTNSTTITLRWIENPTHPQYTYQIAIDYQFLSVVSSGSVIANLTTVDLTSNTQYYWRVKNATGAYTGWFSFTTPVAATTPGLLNITTLEEQNLTTLSDFTVQLYNSTTVLTRTTTTGWVNFTAAEVTSSQYFINVIPNSTYARRAVLATSPANVTVFVPNAATATVDIISFYLMDYTNKFPWTTSYLVVTKNNSVIHSSYFDADAKVTVYLIRGQSYTITLYNGNNIKQWGNYISIGNANVQMVIMESGFDTSTANPYVQQITNSNSNITLTWSAVAGTLNLLNFSIYKGDMNTPVHNIVTTVGNGQSEYIVTNTSDIYYVFAIADTSIGRQELTKIIDYRSGTRTGGIAYTWNYGNYSVPSWVYTVFSLMAIILLAGGFGALHRGEGAIITAFAALFFAYKGWLSMYTGGIGMIVGLLLFAILYHLDSRRKGGY